MVFIPPGVSADKREEMLRSEEATLIKREKQLKDAEVALRDWEHRLYQREAKLNAREGGTSTSAGAKAKSQAAKPALASKAGIVGVDTEKALPGKPKPSSAPTEVAPKASVSTKKAVAAPTKFTQRVALFKQKCKPIAKSTPKRKIPTSLWITGKKRKNTKKPNAWNVWISANKERFREEARKLKLGEGKINTTTTGLSSILAAKEWAKLTAKMQ